MRTPKERDIGVMAVIPTVEPPTLNAVAKACGLAAQQVKNMALRYPHLVALEKVGSACRLRLLPDGFARIAKSTPAIEPKPAKPKPKPKAEKSADAPELAAMIAALRSEHEAYVLERTGGPWVTSAPESIGIRKLANYLLQVSKPDASADVVAASFYGGVRAVAAINKWHGEKSVKASHLGENVSEIINAYKTHKEHEQRNKPATRVEKSHDATVAELRRRAESGQLG